MGLLSAGSPLSWSEAKQHANYVREHGITQFLNHFRRLSGKQGDSLKWGDEIEYIVVKFDHEQKKVRVNTRAYDILQEFLKQEDVSEPWRNQFLWRPEYGSYMIEGTPGLPYGGTFAAFNLVEENMRRRRAAAKRMLVEDEAVLSIGNFPRLGCPDFLFPPSDPTPNEDGAVSKSLFFPDAAINPHPRFALLTRNIRERRGRKVIMNVPIFKDTNTPENFTEDFQKYGDNGEAAAGAKADHIYMDAMGFGMGCCCLQVTFQAVNVSEARWLYDQLTPITPILLALSASTPIFRGLLADVDSRWNVISGSVDDRTCEELGEEPLSTPGARLIPKSRYDTTSSYLYFCSAAYNDIELVHDKAIYDRMLRNGVDTMLAKHIAHLFIRDPIMLYSDRVDLDDLQTLEHFENIQSSNWQNMRFKIPPVENPSIGWRVEFRPTEVQLTDFENAAYVAFVVLLTRVLVSFRLSFLIPVSKVNANMERAQGRDAVLNQKFFFRLGLATCDTPPDLQRVCTPDHLKSGGCSKCGKPLPESFTSAQEDSPHVAQFTEMTADEIVNGRSDFPGLVPLIFQYLDSADVDVETRCKLQQYLKFISQRASGKIMTMARWMRSFVQSHPKYNQDSVVTDEINYDLLRKVLDIQEGRDFCPKLLGEGFKGGIPRDESGENWQPTPGTVLNGIA